jgi:hypothetical protein
LHWAVQFGAANRCIPYVGTGMLSVEQHADLPRLKGTQLAIGTRQAQAYLATSNRKRQACPNDKMS